jgi:hypothetical protein
MKTLRACVGGCLLVIGACCLSGCATTSHKEASASQRAVPNSWDDDDAGEAHEVAQVLLFPLWLAMKFGGPFLARP